MKSKRQSEAGLSRIENDRQQPPPPAWFPCCGGPSGGLGTGHVGGPPGFESEAAS